jgi:hypothetical protein
MKSEEDEVQTGYERLGLLLTRLGLIVIEYDVEINDNEIFANVEAKF